MSDHQGQDDMADAQKDLKDMKLDHRRSKQNSSILNTDKSLLDDASNQHGSCTILDQDAEEDELACEEDQLHLEDSLDKASSIDSKINLNYDPNMRRPDMHGEDLKLESESLLDDDKSKDLLICKDNSKPNLHSIPDRFNGNRIIRQPNSEAKATLKDLKQDCKDSILESNMDTSNIDMS